MIEIITDVEPVPRIETGLYSLDRAFLGTNDEDIGVPIGTGYELFGQEGVGKSTFAYSLSGLLSLLSGNEGIALADYEGFDKNYLRIVFGATGYDGKVKVIRKSKDEETLDELASLLDDETYNVGILDSIGSISPISEKESEIGSANMGRRALAMAQFSRKMLPLTREFKATLFATNHWYPSLDGYGYNTPGGEVKKYLLTIRILLKRKETFDDGSYVLEGKTYKNRWGKKDSKFYVFSLAGKGIHRGMTALIDGANKGVVNRGTVVKIGDESYGYISNIIKKAQEGDDEFFEPFLEAVHDK